MKPLFILEMANNHCGDMDKAKSIIDAFRAVVCNFPEFDFAIKFQRRNLDCLIHPDYRHDDSIPYIKRFLDTQITVEQLQELVDYAKSHQFKTACTPFDEVAVDEIADMGLDYIKIGSCSVNDWPLLQKISKLNMPVILSTGGCTMDEVEKSVSFFDHRKIDLSILHCVGLYPTVDHDLSLDRIDMLKERFPGHRIGYSTHEPGTNALAVSLAMAKGATIFEKHVDIDAENRNDYSVLPEELRSTLTNAAQAFVMCDASRWEIVGLPREKIKLSGLKRCAYLKKDMSPGDIIHADDVLFAMPCTGKDHVSVSDFDKYTSFRAEVYAPEGRSLVHTELSPKNGRRYILLLHDNTIRRLNDAKIPYPEGAQMEISHHYGLDRFQFNGMRIITLINESYCKKLLLLNGGQKNPEHYHKSKKETFYILEGSAYICVDGINKLLNRGEMITIEPGEKHSIAGGGAGAIIEELSTNHQPDDSFYTDDDITNNKNRKTVVYL